MCAGIPTGGLRVAAVENLQEDDDTDYKPMEEETEFTEEAPITRAMNISEAKERAQWITLEVAIRCHSKSRRRLSWRSSFLHLPRLVSGCHHRSSSTRATRTRQSATPTARGCAFSVFLFIF
jgi:hypothetical protein